MVRKQIYADLDFQIRRKERWCLMGINGAGKSTLLKLIAGAAEPDKGSVTIGASVKMGYFAQHAMELLDGEDTVFESLEQRLPASHARLAAHARRLLSVFPAMTSRRNAACFQAAKRRAL